MASAKLIGFVRKTEEQEKKVPLSLRVPEGVKDLLQAAEQATGENVTDLVTECVKTSLHAVVEEILRKRADAQAVWAKKSRPHHKN